MSHVADNATLEVREQVHLGFKRMLAICLDSVRHRLMRSSVTLAIIALAIAFLASIMTDGYVGRSLRDTVADRAATATAYSTFLSRVTRTPSKAELLARIAAADDLQLAALLAWAELPAEDADSLLAPAQDAVTYLAFLDRLPAGRRVLLVEDQVGYGALLWLQQAEHRQQFHERLAAMPSVRIPGGKRDLDAFLDDFAALDARLATIAANYTESRAEVVAACAPMTIPEALEAAAADGSLGTLLARFDRAHFSLDTAQQAALQAGIQYESEHRWAVLQLRHQAVRKAWPLAFQEAFSPGEALLACARDSSRLDWVVEARAGAGEPVDRERLLAVALAYREHEELLAATHALTGRYGEQAGLSSRSIWLITVSILVCVVGIANAMLMSVLERFQEIATMKCLGARHETIAFLFITESVVLGVVGGAVGVVAGMGIALTRHLVGYGSYLLADFPWSDLGWIALICFPCSLVLAVLAAIYPASAAARMAPLEAMRVD